ncbi:hydroxypyruvate isomerase family protein [Lacihabitans sp. CS3-21]|uniref:hydroxypyruvate isomerase family protein n=1 Tax=Lacihabitans sp. CS3-21 TaxID=2487332 RepID=UPI0020CF1E2F|nr:TIM barrel protein [Lacihabitans sp. CS3-21]MCP9748058.1 hydroxypyruvate isomerase [Lacihabitans sp. CS3-21]
MENSLGRRETVKKIIGGSFVMPLMDKFQLPVPLKGNIKHSVCKWCYGSIPLEEFAIAIKKMGINAIDLISIEQFPILKKHDIHCSMVSISSSIWSITKGWNKTENHEGLIKWYKYLIDETAKAGFKNIICFSGNRDEEINDEEGLDNCVEGLSKIIPYAEQKKVTLVMELLNSKIDHKNYMCDTTDWGVELVRMLDSENFKLLYDIYHMQIMEGDVIRTITENKDFIGHYHTGGVPGRAEIDQTQELNYPAIIKAIIATGYKGYLGQEFIPKNADKLTSLKSAVELCDL